MKIKIGEKEVILDVNLMAFNEHNLSEYIEKEAAWFDYFGAMLADAEFYMHRMQVEYDKIYSQKYAEAKDNGATEKRAEAAAQVNDDVIKAKMDLIESKHNVKLLQQHLMAWKMSHDNAQSRGHTLRKEMDILNRDIRGQRDENLDDKIDSIVQHIDVGNLNLEM